MLVTYYAVIYIPSLNRLAHHKCVSFKGSERLKSVINALTSDKFYRLPPDKENPAYIQQVQEIDTNLSHNMNELAP